MDARKLRLLILVQIFLLTLTSASLGQEESALERVERLRQAGTDAFLFHLGYEKEVPQAEYADYFDQVETFRVLLRNLKKRHVNVERIRDQINHFIMPRILDHTPIMREFTETDSLLRRLKPLNADEKTWKELIAVYDQTLAAHPHFVDDFAKFEEYAKGLASRAGKDEGMPYILANLKDYGYSGIEFNVYYFVYERLKEIHQFRALCDSEGLDYRKAGTKECFLLLFARLRDQLDRAFAAARTEERAEALRQPGERLALKRGKLLPYSIVEEEPEPQPESLTEPETELADAGGESAEPVETEQPVTAEESATEQPVVETPETPAQKPVEGTPKPADDKQTEAGQDGKAVLGGGVIGKDKTAGDSTGGTGGGMLFEDEEEPVAKPVETEKPIEQEKENAVTEKPVEQPTEQPDDKTPPSEPEEKQDEVGTLGDITGEALPPEPEEEQPPAPATTPEEETAEPAPVEQPVIEPEPEPEPEPQPEPEPVDQQALAADRLFKSASQWIDSGHPDQAFRELELALQFDRSRLEDYFQMAIELEQNGYHQTALDMYDRVIQLRPDHYKALIRKGQLLETLAGGEAAEPEPEPEPAPIEKQPAAQPELETEPESQPVEQQPEPEPVTEPEVVSSGAFEEADEPAGEEPEPDPVVEPEPARREVPAQYRRVEQEEERRDAEGVQKQLESRDLRELSDQVYEYVTRQLEDFGDLGIRLMIETARTEPDDQLIESLNARLDRKRRELLASFYVIDEVDLAARLGMGQAVLENEMMSSFYKSYFSGKYDKEMARIGRSFPNEVKSKLDSIKSNFRDRKKNVGMQTAILSAFEENVNMQRVMRKFQALMNP